MLCTFWTIFPLGPSYHAASLSVITLRALIQFNDLTEFASRDCKGQEEGAFRLGFNPDLCLKSLVCLLCAPLWMLQMRGGVVVVSLSLSLSHTYTHTRTHTHTHTYTESCEEGTEKRSLIFPSLLRCQGRDVWSRRPPARTPSSPSVVSFSRRSPHLPRGRVAHLSHRLRCFITSSAHHCSKVWNVPVSPQMERCEQHKVSEI